MGDAIGQMLTSAVGIAISPLPLIAVILMLTTPRGRLNGVAFAAGWTFSLAVLVTAIVLASVGAKSVRAGGGAATWTLWLKLALGLLFLLMGLKQWRKRPREGHEAEPPGWMKTIDRFTPGKSAGLAAALAVANPKNLVLAVGGAVSVASSTADSGGKAVAAVLMVLIASVCTTLPVAVYLLGGDKATRILADWKQGMARHNTAIMTTVLVILGTKYTGDALSGLSA
ncbi:MULTISPECIES: GAP family protein [unclassified Streptomyces]|uniref:GAP family protein n=1 Tax=unclassified Streptomyces TaxID=2593676 RepID=UPI000DC7D715|nr:MULTISPECIES: GAP family protein [unclassified Streptomyces]AWZ03601.1 GAP family protein [Streptomyces sp. ICC4]AWZ10998.1 GAP family protein [Streptomyces sp. ICC1]